MQGYSVHDLYTKALALLGLGVLAGAGALVDYWPSSTSSSLPRPANARVSVPGQVAASAVLSVPSRIDAAPSDAAARPRAVAVPAAVVTGSTAAALPTLAPVLTPSEGLGTSVPLAALTTDVRPEFFDQPIVAHVALALPADPEPGYAPVDHSGAPVARALDEDGDDGLITGAFRKTGTSIRKTSVKTGSSIVGAIRGFSGAVRRALPVL